MKCSLAPRAMFIIGLAVAGVAHAQAGGEPASASLTPSLPPAEGEPAAGYVWAGTWFSNHYAGGYGGGMAALNQGRSLWDDGVVLRADASGGAYTYNAPGFQNESIGIIDADVMAGYRKNTGDGYFSAYAGLSYIEHDNPDTFAAIRGSEFGAAFIAEYTNSSRENLEFNLQGRYSTAFSTYSAAARALYRVSDTVWLGPQVTLYGNDARYEEITAGPMLKVNVKSGEVGLTGGYRNPTKGGGKDGYFASIYFALPITR